MKKIVALFLLLCMMLPISISVAEVTYPIQTEEGFKLKVWFELNAGTSQVYTDLDDSPVWQDFQKVTGIDIEFYHPTYGATAESFSKVLSGGLKDMPHVIVDFQKNYNGGLVAAYDDGLIYDLTPYLEEYAPDYYALINSSEEAKRQFYNEDGQVLAFSVWGEDPQTVADCFIIQQDWLDEFNMDVTTWKTFDDIEKYFDAVLAKYPDVVPYASSVAKMKETFGKGFNVIVDDFYVEDGVVKYYANGDNYKAMVEMLAEWYQKGYLSKDFATLKNTAVRKEFSAKLVASSVVPIGNAYSDAQAANNRIAKGPYLSMNEEYVGHLFNKQDVNLNEGYDAVITQALPEEYIPIVCQFLNYSYSEEGAIYANWGPENLTWTWVDGQRKHTDWVLHNEKYETSIMHNCCRLSYWPRVEFTAETFNPNLLRDEVVLALRQMYSPMPGWDSAWFIPSSVQLTLDEANDRSDLMTDIETYANESFVQFVKGDKTVAADWDAYIAQLEKLGLSDAIEITQGAYDRYMKR